ncbi:MAG: hypothetical protein ACYC0C_07795 [Devosia sp.]
MIDEDTHLSLHPEGCVIGSVPLGNVHPSKSIKTTPDLHPAGSQEPRRPRFSFFHLHNVKELTSDPGNGSTSWKLDFHILGNTRLLPVTRQHLCPFLISAFVAAPHSRSASAMAVYMAGHICCQHPKMTKSTFFKNADFAGFWVRLEYI